MALVFSWENSQEEGTTVIINKTDLFFSVVVSALIGACVTHDSNNTAQGGADQVETASGGSSGGGENGGSNATGGRDATGDSSDLGGQATGGASDTGGTSAVGGAPDIGGAPATGGTPAVGGSSAVTSAVACQYWQGYGFTVATPQSVVDRSISGVFLGANSTAGCFQGSIGPSSDSGQYVVSGFRVAQTEGDTTSGVCLPSAGSVGMRISGSGTASGVIRASLINDEVVPQVSYCAEFSFSGSDIVLPWSSFRTSCGTSNGTGFVDGDHRFTAIGISVHGNDVSPVAFNLCVNSVTVAY
jgi:hypothetical protein